jgi:hypothetical protein
MEHADAHRAGVRAAIRNYFSIASKYVPHFTGALPLAADLESTLREFAAAGPMEPRDNGAPLTTRKVLGNSAKPPLHLRLENHNLTRRPLAGGKLAPRAVLSSCASSCLYLYRDSLWALGGL